MEKNIYEIWHSDVLDKYRLELLDKNRKGLCRKCDHNDYPELDNQFYFIDKMKNFLKSFINY